jgi:hypothetical protein
MASKISTNQFISRSGKVVAFTKLYSINLLKGRRIRIRIDPDQDILNLRLLALEPRMFS